MSLRRRLALLAVTALGGGCAHQFTNEWSPVESVGDRMEVRLHLDVAVVGEPVALYRRVCAQPYPSGAQRALACGLEYVGTGTVAAVHDNWRRAVVRLPPEVRYTPDLVVVRPAS